MSLGSPIKAEKITSLIDQDLPPLASWINPGILPKRGMALCGGHAKIGKSFLALEYARSLATGTKLFGCPEFIVPEPCRVLYIEQELGVYGLQKRVKKIFANENRALIEKNLWYVSQQPRMKLDDTTGGRQVFFDLVNEVKPNVLILDPMGKLHSGDENEAQAVEKIINTVEKLKKVGEEWDMSVVMIHHFGKPPQKNGEKLIDEFSPYQFRGSSKWFDAPDTLQTVIRTKTHEDNTKSWWSLKSKFIFRHDEEIESFILNVNQNDDLKVTFQRFIGRPQTLEGIPVREKPAVVKPLLFQDALPFAE